MEWVATESVINAMCKLSVMEDLDEISTEEMISITIDPLCHAKANVSELNFFFYIVLSSHS